MAIIPDSDVNLAFKVRDALNGAGGSVGNNVTSFFSSAAKINHWSKFKPVRYPADFTDKSAYWKAADGNCGFTPKSTGAYADIPLLVDGTMNGWVYNLPRGKYGTINEPMRLGDFRGYDSNAHPMVSDFFVPSQMSNQQTSASFDADALVANEGGTSVTLADLSLKNHYAGVVVVNSSGVIKKAVIGDSLSGGTFHVNVPCYDLTADTYTVYPMISATSAVGVSGQNFYTLPNTQAKTIKIVTSNFVIAVLATRRLDGTQAVDYTISITNSSAAVTWTNNTYKLRFSNKEFSDLLVNGETSGSLTSPLTVAANTTTTFRGTITGVSNALWNELSMTLWVSFNNGNQIGSGAIVSNSQT